MFIGRQNELQFLNDCYESHNAEFVIIYGRRRVGKTETLAEFCKNKRSIFYTCRELTDQIQLQAFSEKLADYCPISNYYGSFQSWDKAFEFIGSLSSTEKTLVIIDEFPYLCKSNKSIPSLLQVAWDTNLKNKNVMLVLCGSSMSFIEKELLAEKNPLYGRATGIYKMQPMPYYDAIKFFPNYSDEDKMLAYAILGGIPHYLRQFNPKISLEDNIKRKILTKGAVLYNEVEFLLRQELREVTVYNTIINAIAVGNSSFNDIMTNTQIEKSKLSVYLKNLIDLNIIVKEYSVTATANSQINANKGLYQLTDSYFRFWYSFVYDNLSFLELNDVDSVWEEFIEKNLHGFAAKPFENVCLRYTFELNKGKQLPFSATSIGRWWGKVTKEGGNGLTTSAEEIDVLATDKNNRNYILGECKFTNSAIDVGTLTNLKSKFITGEKTYYYLFSLSGFSDKIIKLAETSKDVVPITLHEVLSVR